MQILTWNSGGNKGSSIMAPSPAAAVITAPGPALRKPSKNMTDLSDVLSMEMELWREKDRTNPGLGSLNVKTALFPSDVSECTTAPGSARTSVSSTTTTTTTPTHSSSTKSTQSTPRQDTSPKTHDAKTPWRPDTPPKAQETKTHLRQDTPRTPPMVQDEKPKTPPSMRREVSRRRSSKSSAGSYRSSADATKSRPSLSSMRAEVGGPTTPTQSQRSTGARQPSQGRSERRSRLMLLIRGEAEEREQKLVPHHRVVEAIERRQKRYPESKALSLSSIEKTFEAQKWLTDASINFVYTLFNDCGLDTKNIGLPESMLRKEDAKLPKSILLMDPAIAFWLTIEQDEHAISEAMKKQELGDRRLVACPVNDNWDGGKANGGSHWSLLVGWAATAKGDFNFVHYDSMADGHGDDSSSYRHAQQLAARLAGKEVAVSQGACPQQENGFDCGMYVLMISATIAGAVLTAGKGPLAKRDKPVWEKNFKLMTPEEVTKRRGQYYQMAKADI